MRRRKTSPLNITELAENLCETIRLVEEGKSYQSKYAYRPINSSTLLRSDGKYRPLLEAYLADKQLNFGGLEVKSLGPIGRRRLKSKECEIGNISAKLDRANRKIVSLSNKLMLQERHQHDGGEIDAIGKSAKALFDLLISTGIFKFDESSGDLLFVSRSRRIAIARRDIAPYLNWHKIQMANIIID